MISTTETEHTDRRIRSSSSSTSYNHRPVISQRGSSSNNKARGGLSYTRRNKHQQAEAFQKFFSLQVSDNWVVYRCAFGKAGVRALVFKHLGPKASCRWQVHFSWGHHCILYGVLMSPGTTHHSFVSDIWPQMNKSKERPNSFTPKQSVTTKTMDRWNAILASDHSLTITLHSHHKDSGFGNGRPP